MLSIEDSIKFAFDHSAVNSKIIYNKVDNCIDVEGSIDISNLNLDKIPVKFGSISKNFYCNRNRLTTFEGSPTKVGGNFYCDNNQLTSLEGCPTEVGGDFYCYNNQLTSLAGSPKKVGGDFNCRRNNLTTLKGSPNTITECFDCRYNSLTTLEDCPIYIGGYVDFRDNPLEHIIHLLGCKIQGTILVDKKLIKEYNEIINREIEFE